MGAAREMVCAKGCGQTKSNDSCGSFSPKQPVDGIHDPNGWNEKETKWPSGNLIDDLYFKGKMTWQKKTIQTV